MNFVSTSGGNSNGATFIIFWHGEGFKASRKPDPLPAAYRSYNGTTAANNGTTTANNGDVAALPHCHQTVFLLHCLSPSICCPRLPGPGQQGSALTRQVPWSTLLVPFHDSMRGGRLLAFNKHSYNKQTATNTTFTGQ